LPVTDVNGGIKSKVLGTGFLVGNSVGTMAESITNQVGCVRIIFYWEIVAHFDRTDLGGFLIVVGAGTWVLTSIAISKKRMSAMICAPFIVWFVLIIGFTFANI
jgi:hypothetical protein